jgi:GntR family transcriptional regulator
LIHPANQPATRPQVREALQGALLAADPLYKQVKNRLVRSLAEGEWKPGAMLPSEPRLASRFGVGISTIRAAIGELVAARVLARRQGKGTSVPLHDDRLSVYQFFHVVRNDGVKELPVSELLSLSKAKADDEVADLLRLPRGAGSARVFKLRNVLRVSGIPVVLSDIVIPAALFPGLSEAAVREGGTTLYAVYQSRFGISIIRTVERLQAIKADAAASKILGIRTGDPILEVRRIAYTFNDVPVEFRRSRVDTRQFHYFLDLGSVT